MGRFDVDGLPGHREGSGLPALLLHGGPGLSDYMGPLAEELDGLLETIRYTQRGTPPSTSGPPYTVEAHVEDAIAVLDHFELERAWAIGHSWGGHLALHLAVAHPERVSGLICVNALGAYDERLEEFGRELRSRIPVEDAERADTLEGPERLALLWPGYFADPSNAPEMPDWGYSSECNADTFVSIHAQFEAGTLAEGLPKLDLPALFVHGEKDPFPTFVSQNTFKLIRGAVLVEILDAGHFPWLERRGVTRGIVNRFLH
jgi:pimeloyl-ACP methyl ester carboxylesterase